MIHSTFFIFTFYHLICIIIFSIILCFCRSGCDRCASGMYLCFRSTIGLLYTCMSLPVSHCIQFRMSQSQDWWHLLNFLCFDYILFIDDCHLFELSVHKLYVRKCFTILTNNVRCQVNGDLVPSTVNV